MCADQALVAAERALEMAHNSARHGSDAARSGTISDDIKYVGALLAKAQSATRSWASWEAINTLFAPGEKAAQAIGWLELTAMSGVRTAMARDAILGAFSLSDADNQDRLTLCRLANWLSQPGKSDALSSRQWAIDQGHSPAVAAWAAEQNALRVARLKSVLVADWKQSPTATELKAVRETVRPTRNHLAHALDADLSHLPTVDQLRHLISLTLDLATDAAFLWSGSAVNADTLRQFATDEALKFWQYAFAEPIRLWEKDMDARRQQAASS